MKTRILFIGGTPRGLELIKFLVQKPEVVVSAFIMREDEHETVKVSGLIEKICQDNRIPAEICRRIEKDRIPELLRLKPDVAFVCGWRTLIPAALYKEIPLGCLAAHDSLLPKYRGFAPTAWAIINGEKETGVTLFKIDDRGVDAGDIFGQKRIAIAENETASDVYPRIVKASVGLYKEFLDAYQHGEEKFFPQDESKATYTKKRTPEDGEICWSKPAREIFNFIRALTPPYPYAWMRHKGEKVYIKKAALTQYEKGANIRNHQEGTVISVSDDGVLVSCQEGAILLQEVMNESNKAFKAQEYFS